MKATTIRSLVFSLVLSLFVANHCQASDYHQDGQGHAVTYTVVDTSGNPVSGQTVRLTLKRISDEAYLDFDDNTFKFSAWTSQQATMSYDSRGGFYFRVISVDTGNPIISGDYAAIVSNEDATYADHQVEVFALDSLGKLIRIHR